MEKRYLNRWAVHTRNREIICCRTWYYPPKKNNQSAYGDKDACTI